MAKRPMPNEREAARADSLSKAEADSLGKHHMAVAANKARKNLAAGQKARELQEASSVLTTPFKIITNVLKRGNK